MRYLIHSRLLGEEDETRVLSLCVWPEPYCFDRTAEDLKEYFQFDFTDEGLSQLEDTLNRVYEEKQAYWKERDGISLLIM